jgi:hypothetical protein
MAFIFALGLAAAAPRAGLAIAAVFAIAAAFLANLGGRWPKVTVSAGLEREG